MNTRPDLAEPLQRMDDFSAFDEVAAGGSLVPQGQMLVQTQGREVTARKVAAPRSMREVLSTLKVYCAQFGETYTYSWEANDRANNRKVLVEGGTIKLANDLVMLYGNCAVDCDITQTQTHWIFKAFFIDYERGVTYARLFQQRMSQKTGMRNDDGRQADLVFQIGQSKAIRNVVLNALASLATFAIEEAKRGLIELFSDEKKRAQAWGFIERVMDENGIAPIRVEAVVGRKLDKFTVRDLARVYTEMRGIHEGLTVADEVYPTEDDARTVQGEKANKDAAGRARDPKPETADAGRPSASASTTDGAAPAAQTNVPAAGKPPVDQKEWDTGADGLGLPPALVKAREDAAKAREAEATKDKPTQAKPAAAAPADGDGMFGLED